VEKKKGKTSGKKRRERLQGKKEGNVLYYVKSEFMNRTVFRSILQNYYIIKVSANTGSGTQIGGFRFLNICLHGPANFLIIQ
jgi:hypothetical protein